MAYQPAPKFDQMLSLEIFGKEVMIRHFEGTSGWNGSITDGAYVGVTVGNRVFIDVRRSTAILILTGAAVFFASVKAFTLRKKRHNKSSHPKASNAPV